jgi:hypothetical protein
MAGKSGADKTAEPAPPGGRPAAHDSLRVEPYASPLKVIAHE